MKATRLLLLNLAAVSFLCLPVVSAYGAAPQDQNDHNSKANHKGNENHGKTNNEHGGKAQEHPHTQAEHNTNHARPAPNANRARSAQQPRGHAAAPNRGNQRTPAYNFRPQDTQRLRQDYNRSNYRREVNTRNRARLSRGGRLPNGWRGHMHRLPPQYLREFPAPPPGYLIGYYDGYAVVYSPNTGLILQFINVY